MHDKQTNKQSLADGNQVKGAEIHFQRLFPNKTWEHLLVFLPIFNYLVCVSVPISLSKTLLR